MAGLKGKRRGWQMAELSALGFFLIIMRLLLVHVTTGAAIKDSTPLIINQQAGTTTGASSPRALPKRDVVGLTRLHDDDGGIHDKNNDGVNGYDTEDAMDELNAPSQSSVVLSVVDRRRGLAPTCNDTEFLGLDDNGELLICLPLTLCTPPAEELDPPTTTTDRTCIRSSQGV